VYQISARLKHACASYSAFCKVCEKKNTKKKQFFLKVWLLVSREWLKSNFECGLPKVESNSMVNFVPFRSKFTELYMCENCDFVVPVNILIPFASPVFLGHTTHYRLHFINYKFRGIYIEMLVYTMFNPLKITSCVQSCLFKYSIAIYCRIVWKFSRHLLYQLPVTAATTYVSKFWLCKYLFL